MKALKLSLLAAAATLAIGGVAHAQEEPAFKLAFNIGANSDYVFRGVSQTDEDPSVFGGVDATIGSIGYAGVWISNVDFNNGTNAEVDVYAGIKPVLGAVTFDFGAIYYGYVDQPSGSHEDYLGVQGGGFDPGRSRHPGRGRLLLAGILRQDRQGHLLRNQRRPADPELQVLGLGRRGSSAGRRSGRLHHLESRRGFRPQ